MPMQTGGLMLFSDREDREIAVAWSMTETERVKLPTPARSACDRDGTELRSLPDGVEVEALASPVYYRLTP